MLHPEKHTLKLKRLGIDTQHELVVFMHRDCHVCRSEGFEALTRLLVHHKNRQIVATLNVISDHILHKNEAGLSESAWKSLNAMEGDAISLSHLPPIESMKYVRAKMYGKELDAAAYQHIITDIVQEKYSNIFLASFISSCAGNNMSIKEICFLTDAMVASGSKLKWDKELVMDKHCIGGLPGNRTTMIVVPIVTALGLTMPKTSSRAITSPAGTADVMEAVAPVNLDTEKIREVVNKEGGCIAWGGSVKLSPADDILIRVERALDIDSEGQMIASILSKKAAAGSTHVLIDIPVGPTAKIRTPESASRLSHQLYEVAKYIGINIKVLLTDGSQPVGNGIGPALEASDVLSVLRNEKNAPADLRERSLLVASEILEQSGKYRKEEAYREAEKILNEGKAYEKFKSICNAQGGFREPVKAPYTKEIRADRSGVVTMIDTRKLARVAKLVGAPTCPSAGLYLHKHLHDKVTAEEAIITLHAESKGELEYALGYLESQVNIIKLDDHE